MDNESNKGGMSLFWIINIIVAWHTGGFWWVIFNVFFPVAIIWEIIKFILSLFA